MRYIFSRLTCWPGPLGTVYRSLFYYFLCSFCVDGKIGVNSQATSTSTTSECFSCMSKGYLEYWKDTLTLLYYLPSNFTDLCSHPDIARPAVGTKPCPGPCLTLAERKVVGGVTVGYNYIRGCSNRLVIWEWDGAATKKISTHATNGKCFNMPAKLLLPIEKKETPPNGKQQKLLFEQFVLVCPCRGKRCNGNNVAFSSTNNATALGATWISCIIPSSLWAWMIVMVLQR